ncbi:hypothetical protein ON010_g1479 [Phytophthora cinnamomi]|nr:hypothetical protein ON010_g1479 [Phytophthora cinnamomi]
MNWPANGASPLCCPDQTAPSAETALPRFALLWRFIVVRDLRMYMLHEEPRKHKTKAEVAKEEKTEARSEVEVQELRPTHKSFFLRVAFDRKECRMCPPIKGPMGHDKAQDGQQIERQKVYRTARLLFETYITA